MSSWFSSWQNGAGRTISIGGRQVKLLRVLAEGGYALIFEAQDVNSGEGLAVKRMLAPDKETQARAEYECCAHAQLRHQHVLPFMGMTKIRTRDGGFEFFVLMPLCDSGHLWDYASSRPLPMREKLRVLAEVASGLAHMHGVPLSHHDLKLENILLDDDGNGHHRCLLCDFGSSTSETVDCATVTKQERLELEERITRFCTPMYRAPEMCDLYAGLPIGPAADVWALGCVFYVLCFGSHPFAEGSSMQILAVNWAPPRGRHRLCLRSMVQCHSSASRVPVQCPRAPRGETCLWCDRSADASMLELIRAMLRADPRDRPTAKAIAAAARALGADLERGVDEKERLTRLTRALRSQREPAEPPSLASAGNKEEVDAAVPANSCVREALAGTGAATSRTRASLSAEELRRRQQVAHQLQERAESLRRWEYALLRTPPAVEEKPPAAHKKVAAAT